MPEEHQPWNRGRGKQEVRIGTEAFRFQVVVICHTVLMWTSASGCTWHPQVPVWGVVLAPASELR